MKVRATALLLTLALGLLAAPLPAEAEKAGKVYRIGILRGHNIYPNFLTGLPGYCALWALGYPDQAKQKCDEGLALAQELNHPFTLAIAFFLAAQFDQFRPEPRLTQERVEASMALCTEQGFPIWLAWGTIIRGRPVDEGPTLAVRSGGVTGRRFGGKGEDEE